jgi:hypothetical protein
MDGGVNLNRTQAYTQMLERGFRINVLGVAMHKPNAAASIAPTHGFWMTGAKKSPQTSWSTHDFGRLEYFSYNALCLFSSEVSCPLMNK